MNKVNYMTIQPLFSVLIANYNNGKYLMDAIESVRSQTYSNWEIILVDDASTDNSADLYVDLEKDERIRIYRNDKNMGCGYTKRRCAELANGELCGFLDPDDALTLDALEVMVQAHVEHPDASLINSTYFIADVLLNVMQQSTNECQIPNDSSFLEYGHGICVFAVYKNEYYKQTDGISENILRAVDHDLYFKLEEVGRVFYIDRPLYFYRQGTGNNISLGNNSRKALYWDCVVRIDACRRRGKSIEDLVFPYIESAFNDAAAQAVNKRENEIRKTRAYRVGRLISLPYLYIRKLWKK